MVRLGRSCDRRPTAVPSDGGGRGGSPPMEGSDSYKIKKCSRQKLKKGNGRTGIIGPARTKSRGTGLATGIKEAIVDT